MSRTLSSEDLDELVAEIGKTVYIDVAKWHLYLSDAHLDEVLAKQLAPLISGGKVDEAQVMQVLSGISVPVGGGRRELPLSDLLPMQCQVNLMDVLENFQQQL